MITIKNYTTSLTPFTLVEKTTIPNPNYILELVGKETDETTLLFLTGDTSNNTLRYNYYPIDLSAYNLIEGQYNYLVWQTPNNNLTTSGLTSNDVVESGFCYIESSGTTQNVVYNQPQTKYVFQ